MPASESPARPDEMVARDASGTATFRRIVVPLDGSAVAEQALPYAETLARLAGAPLHLVRVIDPTHLGAFDGRTAVQRWIEEERRVAQQYLVGMERDLRQRQLTVSAAYRLGPAAREILAATQSGDLLVMATHGRSGLGKWFLGSVAEAALRRAAVPILLVRASEAGAGAPVVPPALRPD